MVVKSIFDVKSLHWKSIRAIEFYHAAKMLWLGAFEEVKAKTPFPFVTFHIDLWTAKSSGEKYMGKSNMWTAWSPWHAAFEC